LTTWWLYIFAPQENSERLPVVASRSL